MADNT